MSAPKREPPRLNDFQIRRLSEQVSAAVMSGLGVEQVTATIGISKTPPAPLAVAYDIQVLVNGQKPTDEQNMAIAKIIAPILARAMQFAGAN